MYFFAIFKKKLYLSGKKTGTAAKTALRKIKFYLFVCILNTD